MIPPQRCKERGGKQVEKPLCSPRLCGDFLTEEDTVVSR